jgi:hypothetical protein
MELIDIFSFDAGRSRRIMFDVCIFAEVFLLAVGWRQFPPAHGYLQHATAGLTDPTS